MYKYVNSYFLQPYYSPQIVKREKYCTFAADCFAMGVMLFVMLNNKYPVSHSWIASRDDRSIYFNNACSRPQFHWDDLKLMYAEQSNPQFIKTRYTKKFPEDLKDLQEGLFAVDELQRTTMAQTLKHPWIVRRGK